MKNSETIVNDAAADDAAQTKSTETQEAPAPKPKATKKKVSRKKAVKKAAAKKTPASKKPTGKAAGTTFEQASEAYLAAMAKAGKASSTMLSYRRILTRAFKVIAGKTPIANIDERMLKRYDGHKLVTRTALDEEKAKPSIDQARRVVRLVIRWCEDQGLIEATPSADTDSKS